MKITIVTPTYKRAGYLDAAILSVLGQAGDFSIEYIVQDGGSGSDVLDVLRKWDTDIKSGKFVPRCCGIEFKYVVEKDRGMYDALNKGFAGTSGDVMAWINSDDMYHPYAFATIARIYEQFPDVDWLTGIPNSYNFYGGRGGRDIFPDAYSRRFIEKGYYDVKYLK